jgi:Domain of unknown function (DUF5666)
VKSLFKKFVWACYLVVLALLASCGGVGTDGTGPSTNTINVGVATEIGQNTVTVNGVSYIRTDASISDGFGQAIKADDLRLGMWVEVSGVANEVSGTALAQSIRVRPAARGVVSAVDAVSATVSVLGTSVRYDNATTVLEGVDSASQIALGDLIEVHGLLGEGSGTVEASRIERLPANAGKRVELRGRVSDLDAVARTLTVGRQAVRYDSATLTLPKALANGQIVRVSALVPPVGTEAWVVKNMTSDQPLLDNLDFAYVEGVTTNFIAGPKFDLEGVPVNATEANLKASVTANGQRVAVIGSLLAGTLNAKSVVRSLPGQPMVFVLGAELTDYKSTADFRVRGVTVDAKSAVFVGGTAADLADGRRVRVTGSISGRKLIATKVQVIF